MSLQETIISLRRSLRRLRISSLLLGLSGGPDSVLAFHLLRLAGEGIPGFRLGVAHANFNLRGEESLRDERFVRTLISAFPTVGSSPIEQFFTGFDTYSYCRQNSLSIEMGARRLRHDWFDSIIATHGYDRIATGHNASDNEETLLLNLLRGSGTRGLKGMSRDNGRIFRPLLHLHRPDILRLLDEIPAPSDDTGLKFVTDSSNLTDLYRRNFLRNRILPELEERWEGMHTALQTSLHLLEEENKIVEQALSDALAPYSDTLPIAAIRQFASPLTLIARWLQPYGIHLSMAQEILRHVEQLAEGVTAAGKRWQLTGHTLLSTPTALRIESSSADANDTPLCLLPPEKTLAWESCRLDETVAPELMQRISQSGPQEIWLPYPPERYAWRHPRPTDRLRLHQSGGSKKVSDILKEHKIPAAMRGEVNLLVDAATDTPIWLPGLRRAAHHLIAPPTSSQPLTIYHLQQMPHS